SVRGVLRDILEDAGAIVLVADSVKQAQAMLEQSLPDAVLTDLELTPQWRGGVAILDQVKRKSRWCPVLLLTAWSEAYDELATPGFDAVLLKPAHPIDLVEAIGAAILHSRREPRRGTVSAA